MSAIGSARARGPEMWSDMTVLCPSARLVAGLVQQRLQRRMLEASAACGWSSTCWKAAFTRCAFRISLTVPG